jgi:hypothetical protein
VENQKICTGCKIVKPHVEFGKLATVRSGRRSRCKQCERDAASARYHANAEEMKAKWRAAYAANPEHHRTRAKEWHRANLERSKAKARAWKATNPDRVAEYNASHYAENREYHRSRRDQWAKDNRQRLRDYMRGWYATNPGKHSEYSNRRREDPRVRIENAIRCRIWYGIVRGSKRGRGTMQLLGYSTDELKLHLERQFLKGMSWDNFGEWHIDHILPLSSFSYTTPDEPDFKRAWALTNLRPIWAKENLEKGAKRLTLL